MMALLGTTDWAAVSQLSMYDLGSSRVLRGENGQRAYVARKANR